VELGAQGLAHRGGDGGEFPRELIECVAEAVAETRPREERAHALGGAVEVIDQNASDALGWFLVDCRAWERLTGLGKSCRTGLLNVAQMPEHTAADNRRQTDLVRETAIGLFIGQKLGGEGQPAPGEHRDQTLVATRTDQAIEDHGEMVEDRARLQTEPHAWPARRCGPPLVASGESGGRSGAAPCIPHDTSYTGAASGKVNLRRRNSFGTFLGWG